jgi:hypothetical protein
MLSFFDEGRAGSTSESATFGSAAASSMRRQPSRPSRSSGRNAVL